VPALRRPLARITFVAATALAVNYLTWRILFSINWPDWYIAVPLLLAEIYSFVDSALFGLTMWRMRVRKGSPAPLPGVTVDVLVTCYDEPVAVVRRTVRHARAIRHPHRTYLLDDGASPGIERMAREEGVVNLARGADWRDKPRHAKAGNLNNALFETTGEFLLILDADQVADPRILDRTLGYFADPEVALVQTPQRFYNVPKADPLGSQAPLFYGPIQRGKDGWNAAFFCGSNAVLRREALMRLGVVGYVHDVRDATGRMLRTSGRMLRAARRRARAMDDSTVLDALEVVDGAVRRARGELRAGLTIHEVTTHFQSQLVHASRRLVRRDLRAIHRDLASLGPLPLEVDREGGIVIDERGLELLARRDWSPLAAIEGMRALVTALDVDRAGEAIPVMPVATISVTEDMATAMRLHAQGWRSVYHDEILAHGLAPEDLGSSLKQKLRWAQGSLQVLLRENPLAMPALSAGQRLMYLGTMLSYLQGFSAVVYMAAPALYLLFGIVPVRAYSTDFFWHLLPYLLASHLLLAVVGWGLPTWRGQQYSLALFPLWIQATVTSAADVFFGRRLSFTVTPKTRRAGRHVSLVAPQLAMIAVLGLAMVIGLFRLLTGQAADGLGTLVNVVWASYDLLILSVVIEALLYRGPGENVRPPLVVSDRPA